MPRKGRFTKGARNRPLCLTLAVIGGASLSGGPLLLIKPKPRRRRAAVPLQGQHLANNNREYRYALFQLRRILSDSTVA
jgi:hypothetical protein